MKALISLVGLTMFIHFYTVDIRSVYHELLKQFVAFYKNIANHSWSSFDVAQNNGNICLQHLKKKKDFAYCFCVIRVLLSTFYRGSNKLFLTLCCQFIFAFIEIGIPCLLFMGAVSFVIIPAARAGHSQVAALNVLVQLGWSPNPLTHAGLLVR